MREKATWGLLAASLVFLGNARAVAGIASDFDAARTHAVTGEVFDDAAEVSLEVKAASMRDGARCVYAAPPSNRKYSRNVKLFPGENAVTATTDTGADTKLYSFGAGSHSLRVQLSWAGNNQDYDLHVNEVYYGNTSSGGGTLDHDWTQNSSGGNPIENITYSSVAAGLYRIYVYYYTDNEYDDEGHQVGSPQTTTIRIFVDETQIYCGSRLITEHNGDGTGNGKSIWNVGTVVLHAGDEAGGYAVDGRRLDLAKQAARRGVSPLTTFVVDEFHGPNGQDPVYLCVGDAAQFDASGTLNSGSSNEQPGLEILEEFASSNGSVGTVDGLGVFVGATPGHAQVSCSGYSGAPVVVHVLKVDIAPAATNVCWRTQSETRSLTADSYLGGGNVTWTVSPSSGLDVTASDNASFTFSPADSAPGEYTVTAASALLPDCADECVVRVIKIDLDVDSNYDGEINDDDDLIETSAGGIVAVNLDDDNMNGVPDKDEGYTYCEDDLRAVKLQVLPTTLTSGTVTLEAVSGGGRVRVWGDAEKVEEIALPKVWHVGSDTVPETLYVEAVEASGAARDVGLRLRYTSGGFECEDNVRMTVLQIGTIKYKLNGSWNDIPSVGFTNICLGSKIDFKVIPVPSDATWPSGSPIWGGDASGNGEEKSIIFGAPGGREIIASCGNTVTVKVYVASANTSRTVDWSHGYTCDDNNADSTTVERPFYVLYTACADVANDIWHLRVCSVTGGTDIAVHMSSYQTPNPGFNITNASEGVAAITDMLLESSTSGPATKWATEDVIKTHEEWHRDEWTEISEHYWFATETAMETITVPYHLCVNDVAAAVAAMKTGGSGADAKNAAYRAKCQEYWLTLGDQPGDRPYRAGGERLNPLIEAIRTYGATQTPPWSGLPTGLNAGPGTDHCYQPWRPYSP